MLNPIYRAVVAGIVGIHAVLATILPNGPAWWLSIVVLTMAVRLVLFPLFVKQVKSQRTMQMLQPRMKEIREKHRNDREEMQRQLMALQAEHGNPLLGCLPIFAQIPLFIALFHVLRSFAPIKNVGALAPKALSAGIGYHYADHSATIGLGAATVKKVATAKIFGVPLAGVFSSSKGQLVALGASATPVKIVAVVLILTMGFTTFLTQKQIMGRQTGPVDPQQQATQRLMLYISPLFLAFFGFNFPIGVLLYWLTTNFWSMGQQYLIIRRMPPVVPLATTGAPARPPASATRAGITSASSPASGSARPKGLLARLLQAPTPATPVGSPPAAGAPKQPGGKAAGPPGQDGGGSTRTGADGAAGASGQRPASPAARRPGQNTRPNKRSKGKRKGGRH